MKILEVAIVEMPAISLATRKGSALFCLSMYDGYSAEVTKVCSYLSAIFSALSPVV